MQAHRMKICFDDGALIIGMHGATGQSLLAPAPQEDAVVLTFATERRDVVYRFKTMSAFFAALEAKQPVEGPR